MQAYSLLRFTEAAMHGDAAALVDNVTDPGDAVICGCLTANGRHVIGLPLRCCCAISAAMAFHNFINPSEGWQTHRDEEQFANPYIAVHRVMVSTPTRPEPFSWTVAHRKGAVVVVPVTEQGEFVMVRQERVPIRETIWEFPAGQIDDHSAEDHIRATGLRELQEESGYELAPGGEIVSLGYFFPSAGFTDEHSHLLLARPVRLSPRGTAYDSGEGILGCQGFSAAEFRDMIARGEIRDANTLCAFARMVALGVV